MSRILDARRKAGRETSPEMARPVELHPSVTSATLRFVEGRRVTPKLEPRLQEIMRTGGPWAEMFRSLSARIRSTEKGDRLRLLGAVSATGGEGKTTVAVALSFVLAEEPDARVLLVDADLRHRSLERHLGIKPVSGLADWLKAPEEEIGVQQLSGYKTYVLGAGRPAKHPWELVTSPALSTLFEAAKRDFRYVVVDCPPNIPIADSVRIQENLDALLLVVRARTAPRETILSAVEHLETEKIIGVVFNDVRRAALGYTAYAYKQYGHKRPAGK